MFNFISSINLKSSIIILFHDVFDLVQYDFNQQLYSDLVNLVI